MNVYSQFDSPLGPITAQANSQGLIGVWFEDQTTMPVVLGSLEPEHPVLQQTQAQLEEYFAGKRTRFKLPLAATGTEFQQRVWQALQTIPFAHTWYYQQLANAIDNPKAVRAVGLANGKNPISIIVPCHRVIGKNGKLTGYAGGVDRKDWLLQHEQRWSQNNTR